MARKVSQPSVETDDLFHGKVMAFPYVKIRKVMRGGDFGNSRPKGGINSGVADNFYFKWSQ